MKSKIETIMSMADELFQLDKVMWMYFGGSVAYETYEEGKSDIDVEVVLANFNGTMISRVENIDFFVYGDNQYSLKKRLRGDLPYYNRIFADTIFSADKHLIYLNPKYAREFEDFKNEKFEDYFHDFLECNYFYFLSQINDEHPKKTLHHVYRIRSIIESYIETGKITNICSEPWKTRMLQFKEKYKTEIGTFLFKEIKESIEFIRIFIESLPKKEE